MNIEDRLNMANKNLFFREFTYARSKFKPEGETERELADAIIAIHDEVIGLQVKERNLEKATTEDTSWFSKKVLGTAVGQLNDTKTYLLQAAPIHIQNNSGDEICLPETREFHFWGLICFGGLDYDPCMKLYRSKRTGLVHLFHINDFLKVSDVLFSFWELTEYLKFRESILSRYDVANRNTEDSLLGQYLIGHVDDSPSEHYSHLHERLTVSEHERSFRRILWLMRDRLDKASQGTDYYMTLREFALLTRKEMGILGERLDLMCKRAMENKLGKTSRVVVPRRDCTFAIMNLDQEHINQRKELLENITRLAKYSTRTRKGIGICVCWDNKDFLIDWAYGESEYSFKEEYEKILREGDLFSKIKQKSIPRYEFE